MSPFGGGVSPFVASQFLYENNNPRPERPPVCSRYFGCLLFPPFCGVPQGRFFHSAVHSLFGLRLRPLPLFPLGKSRGSREVFSPSEFEDMSQVFLTSFRSERLRYSLCFVSCNTSPFLVLDSPWCSRLNNCPLCSLWRKCPTGPSFFFGKWTALVRFSPGMILLSVERTQRHSPLSAQTSDVSIMLYST